MHLSSNCDFVRRASKRATLLKLIRASQYAKEHEYNDETTVSMLCDYLEDSFGSTHFITKVVKLYSQGDFKRANAFLDESFWRIENQPPVTQQHIKRILQSCAQKARNDGSLFGLVKRA